jgi:O-succinylbenzoate synthase
VQRNGLVVSEALTAIPDGTLLADATDNRWAPLYARSLAILLP